MLGRRLVRGAGRALSGLFAGVGDVSARAGDVRLAESEELFRLTMDHAPIGMALVDLDGRWVRVNKALCRILGRTEDELRTLRFQEITHPDDLGEDLALSRRLLAGEIDSFQLEKRYARSDGTWVPVRLSVGTAWRQDGALSHAIAQVEDLTREQETTRELAAQERRFRLLADGAEDVVSARIRTVPVLCVEYLSRGVEAFTGRSAEDFQADPGLLLTVLHPDDAATFAALLSDPTRLRGGPISLRCVRDDGTVTWTRTRGEPIYDEQGAVVGAELLSWDVTAGREAEERANAQGRRFQALVEHAADAIVLRDADGVLQYVSPAITRMLGYRPEELVGTSSVTRLSGDQTAVLQAAVDDLTSVPGGHVRTEVRAQHRDGGERWLALSMSNRLEDPDVRAMLVNVHDMTDSRAAQEELAFLASHDQLTGLPSRPALQRHLAEALAGGRHAVGVLFVDLTGLKPVNDILGHARGDAVLRVVAERLFEAVGDVGTVGRFGGDEFVVVTRDLSRHDLVALAEEIVGQLDCPVDCGDGAQHHLSASVGVAVAEEGSTAAQMLANADLAMGVAKRRTGRGVQLFDSTLAEQAAARLSLESDLRGADLDRDLRAYFQPVLDLRTDRLTGAEALLRWQHRERGLVPPGLFVPIAEETGLIGALGMWVLTEACRQQQAWADYSLSVGVNLSPRQLYDPHLARRVAEVLEETGARADRLLFEVTESALIDDRVAAPALAALKDLGVRLALDDFGTGYSSLTSLRRYPFDLVKIDRSFVAEITDSSRDRAIVANLVRLAHDLGMYVVAEGVETEEQLQVLRQVDADVAQGYHLGRPVPAAEVTALLVAQGLEETAAQFTSTLRRP